MDPCGFLETLNAEFGTFLLLFLAQICKIKTLDSMKDIYLFRNIPKLFSRKMESGDWSGS